MLVERLSDGGPNSGRLFYLVCPELGESKIERLATPGVVPKLFEIRVDVRKSRCSLTFVEGAFREQET
jgi:hypothetical protein